MMINPGNPRDFYPEDYEVASESKFCSTCQYYKPPNAHHCSTCKVCIMDMDHHCRNAHAAWLNTCIGTNNLRYFFQFLVWAAVGCLFMVWLEVWEVYGVFYRDYRILKNYTSITRFMLLFSFMSCLAVTLN